MKKLNSTKMGTLGVDPGKTGAAVFLLDNCFVDLIDFTVSKDVVRWLHQLCSLSDIRLACLEKVHAMPGQGVTSCFSFGANYGWWKGVLESAQIPYIERPPQTWMKKIGVPKKKDKTEKPSLEVARALFPDAPLHLKKHHGRADAILMAMYAYLYINGK